MTPGRGRTAARIDWKAVLGIAVSVGLLYFALRDVDPARVLDGIRGADPLLFLAAVTAATVIFAVRAVRWRPLLEPIRPDTAFRPRFAATTIGFMANNLLPARVGEFVRAYALARIENISVVASFGSLVVERLLDGFTVVGFLFLAMAAPGFPGTGSLGGRDIGSAASLVLGVFVAVGLVLVAMVLWPERVLAVFDATLGRVLPDALRRPLHDTLRGLVHGLTTLRRPSLLARAALWSVAVWLVGAVSFWLGFRAFDIAVPFSGALFLQSLIALAVALPSAPGFFGLYEAAVRVGLVELWGVPVNTAMSFAIGFHMGSFIPVTVIGLYYAGRLGISWRQVRRSEEVTERAVEAVERGRPPPGPKPGAPANDGGDAVDPADGYGPLPPDAGPGADAGGRG